MLGQNYFLSLPERVLRSTAALVGGTSLLLTDTLFPDVVRNTTTYRILVGDLQKLLITRIGEIPLGEPGEEQVVSDEFMRKKFVGGTLEAIGLLTVRFSPVWVFAIVGDAAAGSKVFFDRLVDNLKDHDVLAQDATPNSMTDLLEAVQAASHNSATAIDTPPLSRAELESVTDDLVSSYGSVFSSSQPLLTRFEDIFSRMDQVSSREGVSVEEVSGIMTIDAARIQKTGISTGLAIGQTSSELFVEQILDSYQRTLDRINQVGIGSYLSNSLMPYLKAAVGHLDPDKRTWTESQFLDND